MIAIRATLAGFPASTRCRYLAFRSGLKSSGAGRWHVEGLSQAGAPASHEGAPGPASGLARDWREPNEA